MEIKCADRYELKPNIAQRINLAKHAGAARFTYNWGLSERKTLYEASKKSTNAIEQHRHLNTLKKTEFPWMYDISKCAPQEALRNLDRAFKNFFRGISQGSPIGFPKYKRKGKGESFRLTGIIKLKGKSIQLPRLGVIRLKEVPKPRGKILSATIVQEADRWYVCLALVVEKLDPEPVQGKAVGIDLGLTTFATISGGEQILSPKPLADSLKRLKKISRKHSRTCKGSKNRKKTALKLARLHRKNRNIRRDFLHKQTTILAKTKSVIVLEDLDVKGLLRKKRFNRSISDAGWGEFRCMLEYKTRWYGSGLILAPKYYPSSKRCSKCHFVLDKLFLETRQWQCPVCQIKHDREVNAADNLLQYYTESSSGINACGDTSNEANQKFASYVSLNQEIINGINVHKL